jgi:hypothetical protein
MKNAHAIGMRMVGGLAIALALGAGASAQRGSTPGNGRRLDTGNLGNDIREGRGPRHAPKPSWGGEIGVDLTQELALSVHVVDRRGIDPNAVIPIASDLEKVFRLSGGTPGALAAIEIGPALRLDHRHLGISGGTLVSGVFSAIGVFEVTVPSSIDLRGYGVLGAQLSGRRMVTMLVDIEPAVEDAFADWMRLGDLAKPNAAGGAGSKKPLFQNRHGGGALGGASVDGRFATRVANLGNDLRDTSTDFEELGELADPQRAGSDLRQDFRRRSGGHIRR